MGAIIYWGLLRFVLVLFGAWMLYAYMPNYGDWWTMFFVGFAAIVLYPAQISYRKQRKEIDRASRNPICSTCVHFQAENTLCGLLDLHVTKNYTPCNGDAWQSAATVDM